MAPARSAAEDCDGTPRPPRREARQGGSGARRLAGSAGRSFRPIWLGDVGPAAGDRAGPGRRADCHHRRPHGLEAVVAKGLKGGDPFDMDVGGLADESSGQPVRIKGTIAGVAEIAGRRWVSVAFGRGNVVLISEYLTQVMDPLDLKGPGFTIDQFKVFAIKSRVHFRRGFDDSGFTKTILLVEPEQPFLGTVRLEALPYRNVDISKFYPYGDVRGPE